MSDDFNKSIDDQDIEDILNFVREKNSSVYNGDSNEAMYDSAEGGNPDICETDDTVFDESYTQNNILKSEKPEIPKLTGNKSNQSGDIGNTREVAELFRGAQLFPDTTSIIISDLAEAEFKREQEENRISNKKEPDMYELFGSDLTYSKEIDILSIVSRLNSYNEIEYNEPSENVIKNHISAENLHMQGSNGSDTMKNDDKINENASFYDNTESDDFRRLDITEYDETDDDHENDCSSESDGEASEIFDINDTTNESDFAGGDTDNTAVTEQVPEAESDDITEDEFDDDYGNEFSLGDSIESKEYTSNDNKSFNKKWLIIPISAVIILLFAMAAFFMADSNKKHNDTSSVVESEPMLEQIVSEVESAVESLASSEVSSIAPEPEIYTGEYSRLTGLPIDDEDLNIRPVAIMINNIEAAQPLLGISKSDIVYECIVEGGITRLLAVFGNPKNVGAIGSIRSSRPDFIYLAKGLDAIYFHIGTSTQAQALLDTGIITSFDLGIYSSMSWRDNYRMNYLGYEHSLVTSGKTISEGLNDYGARTDSDTDKGMIFSDTPSSISGDKATNMNVVFSSYKSTSFNYNSENQVYTVNQFGTTQYDSEYSVNNTVTNVLVLHTDVYQIDDEGHVSFDVIGSGNGYYMAGGRIINITWQKSSSDDPIHYYTSNGKELEMMRGKSYVCIIPRDGDVSYWS